MVGLFQFSNKKAREHRGLFGIWLSLRLFSEVDDRETFEEAVIRTVQQTNLHAIDLVSHVEEAKLEVRFLEILARPTSAMV